MNLQNWAPWFEKDRVNYYTLDSYFVEHRVSMSIHQYLLVDDTQRPKEYLNLFDHLAILTWLKLARIQLQDNPDAVIPPLFLSPYVGLNHAADFRSKDFLYSCMADIDHVLNVEVVDGREILLPARGDKEVSIAIQLENRYVGIELIRPEPSSNPWPEHYRLQVGAQTGYTELNVVEVLG